MKVKIFVEDVGANHATLEIEGNCAMNGLERLLNGINREHAGVTAKKPTFPERPHLDDWPKLNNGFIPASKRAKNALWGAAMTNGTTVEKVCRKYGVDPDNISPKDCWQMTQDLNERSGYKKTEPKTEK